MLLAFLLMFVKSNIFTGHIEKGIMAGAAVGGSLTGASMNPAPSLGPAPIAGHFDPAWIYLTASVPGMYVAHPTFRWKQGEAFCGEENRKDPAE